MTKRKIGIRYCGGCDPTYERTEMIERVQALVGEGFVFLQHDEEDLDGVVAVNGCLRACVTGDLNERELHYHSVAKEDDFNHLIQWLFAFDQ